MEATRFVVPALEIIDSRIEGWKITFCDTSADNASSARVVLGHPAVAVASLANAVGQFGVSLSASDVIMPGALCGAVDVAAGDLFQATYDGLGTVSVRFV